MKVKVMEAMQKDIVPEYGTGVVEIPYWLIPLSVGMFIGVVVEWVINFLL